MVTSGHFATGTENAALLVGDDGRPRFYFTGEYLYDANTYQRLAGGQILGDYPVSNHLGSSYYQPLMLYHPGDPNLVYIFYGMAFSSAASSAAIDLDMPAWLSVYNINQDSFIVRDSILHGRATESWSAMRHPDGVSWWIATRTHSPSAIQLYKFGINGLELGPTSIGGPIEGGLRAADAGGIAFSADGTKLSAVKANSNSTAPYDGEIWLWDFDCSSGQCSNPKLLYEEKPLAAQPCFSPGGRYLYVGAYINLTNRGGLARYPLMATGDVGPIERIYFGYIGLGSNRGPDGRMYFGPSNQQDFQYSYLDRPDRWLNVDNTGAVVRAGGADYTDIPSNIVGGAGLSLPTLPVRLPELRTPRMLGPDVVACGETEAYELLENCYQNLADITVTAGPGITLQQQGASLDLTFDTAQTLPQIRYVALAHNHPCRTYRDTVWMFVEGSCIDNCQPTFSNTDLMACDSALVHGVWQTNTGIYSELFVAFNGCDSTSTVELTVLPSVSTAEDISACEQAIVHGTTQNMSGTYTETFVSATGCDSTSTVVLTISNTISTQDDVQACDQAIVHGTPRNTSGTYTETFVSAAGCDSTSTVVLTISNTISTQDDVQACDQAIVHGTSQNSSGTYTETFVSAAGCDSTSTVVLTISNTISTQDDVQACDQAIVHGTSQNSSGTYTETFVSAAGCDSTSTVVLTISEAISTQDEFQVCEQAIVHGTSQNTSGTYTETFISAAGCDSTSTVMLQIQESPILTALPTDTLLAIGETLQLNLGQQMSYSYNLTPPSAVDCSTCATATVNGTFAGNLSVQLTDSSSGCQTDGTLRITRLQLPSGQNIGIPNAFSPDGNGINDEFVMFLPEEAQLLSAKIFDRWGNLVSITKCPCDRNSAGRVVLWNGHYSGDQDAHIGVYVWIAEVEITDATSGELRREVLKGDVTLMR